MSDERVKRVYAFTKDLFHQGEMLSNIVEIWESAFPLDSEGSTPSLLLPILCCEAVGGDEDQATAVAAAWFLLYLAAKILDDIEDDDIHLTPWSAIGVPQAINAATGLIFASQLALARLLRMGIDRELALSLLEDFNRTTLRMCAGQQADLTEGSHLCLERYFWIAGAKSGEFFALACRAGALLGSDDQRWIASYSEFGYNLGVLIFVAEKGLRQSRNFSMEQLETIYRKLLETDLAIKTGQMDQVLALDMLIAGLSRGKTEG